MDTRSILNFQIVSFGMLLYFHLEALSFLLDNVEESIESLTKRMLKADLEDFNLVSSNFNSLLISRKIISNFTNGF